MSRLVRGSLLVLCVALVVAVVAAVMRPGGDIDSLGAGSTTLAPLATTSGTDGSLEIATTTAPAPTSTVLPIPSSDTTLSGPDVALMASAVDHYRASEALCIDYANDTGNPYPDPTRYGVVEALEVLDGERVLLRDGLGDHFVVNLEGEPATIYPQEGPQAVLPWDLAFGCPPELVLGSVDH